MSEKNFIEEEDRGEAEGRTILLLLDCIDPLVAAIEANASRAFALATYLQEAGYYGEAQILLHAAREAAQVLLVGQHGQQGAGAGAGRRHAQRCGSVSPEASNQILSLTNPQTFDEADTLIGLRGYCWLRFNPEAGSRALAHVNIRLVQFENISQITLNPVMGRADDGNEGPSSENLLWAGHCHTLCDDQAYPREFKVTDIESKAKRKLVSESGIYISASLDTFWNANLPAAVTLEWVIRGLFLRG